MFARNRTGLPSTRVLVQGYTALAAVCSQIASPVMPRRTNDAEALLRTLKRDDYFEPPGKIDAHAGSPESVVEALELMISAISISRDG